MTGDHHHAEDAVQEAFLNHACHPHRYDPAQGEIGGWLAMLTHRRAVDIVRREQAQPRPNNDTTAILAIRPDTARGPEAGTIAGLVGADVRASLRTLTHVQRQILFLIHTAGYSERAIAIELAIPLGTV